MIFTKPNLILAFLFIAATSITGRSTLQTSDAYEISFLEKDKKIIKVNAQLTLTDSLLYMSPAGPVPKRWPDYVKNLSVQDENGSALFVEKTPEAKWVVSGVKTGQRIQLEYSLSLTHEETDWPGGIDGVAYQREEGIFCTGRALFVMNGEEKEDIEVRFLLPDAWRVSVPWKENKPLWIAPKLDALSESLIYAGTHEEVAIGLRGFKLKFVLAGEDVIRQKNSYAERARELIRYYTKLMGGIPRPAPGQELSTAMVVIQAAGQVDGEVIGNHISMFMDPQGPPQSQMMAWFMFAHEFFHLWNGKTLRVSSTRADWFKEGITNYYTLKALHQIGFIDESGVKAILNNLFYQRYIQDPGLGELSLAEAASTFQKDQHWGLVYSGGLFTGICLDMIIRKNTENRKSLDNLMRHFYQKYGGSQQTYTTADIIAEASRLSGQPLQGFAEKYINGAEQPPVEEHLSHAGIQVSTEGGQLQLKAKAEQTELEKQMWAGFLGRN